MLPPTQFATFTVVEPVEVATPTHVQSPPPFPPYGADSKIPRLVQVNLELLSEIVQELIALETLSAVTIMVSPAVTVGNALEPV